MVITNTTDTDGGEAVNNHIKIIIMQIITHFKYSFFFVCFFVINSSIASSLTFNRIPTDYITPLTYGAIGDGNHDDTEAFRKAIYDSDEQGKVLYIPSGYKFRITGTLNYYKETYKSYTLNLLGEIPIKKGSYTPEQYGGIIVEKGVALFKSAKIKGSIERVCITGKRDLTVHFFDNCECYELVMHGNNISNFGVLFYDSPVNHVSQITQNTFLTLYYFSKNDKTASGFTDSNISFNYINGGVEKNDNACFEWAYYNGSTISNNFIDYYRTIYFPKSNKKQAFVGPMSYSNQYQVFRYFYSVGEEFTSVTFASTADTFNWNDPNTLKKLEQFIPLTYKGKDGKTYDIPPYVATCHSAWKTSIKDAKIERNMKSLVFIHSGLTEYENNRFDVSFIGNDPYKKGQICLIQGNTFSINNRGKFLQNEIKIDGIIEKLESLPHFSIGWTSSYHGRKIQVNNKIYKATNSQDKNGKWSSKWIAIE